ncbi:MAG: hypothetical protein IIA45_07775, partial [Bacteroidetes bacterium]|nr:hypothetical protein [Bacteroidota bacterium]
MNPNNSFNLIDLLASVKRWRRPIIIFTLLAILGSIIITHPRLMAPKYESVAIIYPINPALTDRPYLFKTESGGELSIDLFGGKEDIDRLISISKSSQIFTSVLDSFDLYTMYKIDTSKKYHLSSAISKFKKNFTAAKNEYRGVEIHVKDKNKNTAADIANFIVRKIDEINKGMFLRSRKKIFGLFEGRLKTKQAEVEELTDSLSRMRRLYNIYDINAQSEILTMQVSRTESDLTSLKAERNTLKNQGGNENRVKRLNSIINGLEMKLKGLTSVSGGNKFNLELLSEGTDKVM